jgi:hypothetical protein
LVAQITWVRRRPKLPVRRIDSSSKAGWETAAVVQCYAGGAMHDSAATVLASCHRPLTDQTHQSSLRFCTRAGLRYVSPDLTRDSDPWRQSRRRVTARGVSSDWTSRHASVAASDVLRRESRARETDGVDHSASLPSSPSTKPPRAPTHHAIAIARAMAAALLLKLQEPRV